MKLDLQEAIGEPFIQTLDWLEAAKVEDKLFIGSESAYFLIGTIADVKAYIDKVSAKYKEMCFRRFAELREKLTKLENSVVRGKKESYDNYVRRLKTVAKLIETSYEALQPAKKRMDTFKDMRERCIKDIYYKEYDPGIAILLEGCEVGDYWTSDEWEGAHYEVTPETGSKD